MNAYHFQLRRVATRRALFTFICLASAALFTRLSAQPNFAWELTSTAPPTEGIAEARAVATDRSGNAFITGSFAGRVSFGTNSFQSFACNDAFVAKVSTNGQWLWVRQIGGSRCDFGTGVATDAAGNVFVTGYFSGQVSFEGGVQFFTDIFDDLFLAKYNPNGDLLWARAVGGRQGDDQAYGVTVDPSGNVYVTGTISSATNAFGTNVLTSVLGHETFFLAKADANGNWLWAIQAVGPDAASNGYALTSDANGNVYVTGNLRFGPVNLGGVTLTATNGNQVFVARVSAGGTVNSVEQGGAPPGGARPGDIFFHAGFGIVADAPTSVFVTGAFGGFGNGAAITNALFGPVLLTSQGQGDLFLTHLSTSLNFITGLRAGGSDGDAGTGLALARNQRLYLVGIYRSPRNEATIGNYNLPPALGPEQGFLAQYSLGNLSDAIPPGWVKRIGANGSHMSAVATDSSGNIFVAGAVNEFPGGGAPNQLYLAKMNEPTPPNIALKAGAGSGQGFSFSVNGGVTYGLNFQIEGSSDLRTWQPLRALVTSNGVGVVTDGGATNQSRRYYRAVVP